MIRALLVAVCLAVFPYQGSYIILESGNEKDYEVEYPQEVAELANGGVEDAKPETDYEDAIYEEPVVLHLDGNRLSNSRRGVPFIPPRPRHQCITVALFGGGCVLSFLARNYNCDVTVQCNGRACTKGTLT
nr:snake venom metalloproteinases P-III precursor [Psammophis schokari]